MRKLVQALAQADLLVIFELYYQIQDPQIQQLHFFPLRRYLQKSLYLRLNNPEILNSKGDRGCKKVLKKYNRDKDNIFTASKKMKNNED